MSTRRELVLFCRGVTVGIAGRVALVVGTILSAVNQGSVILGGDATGVTDPCRRELPTSPTIVLAPVLVMPEPASTANCPAVPNGTTVAAAWALPADTISRPADTTAASVAAVTPP